MNLQLDFERARFNMVEQQIRTWEVLDPRVLDLLFRVRREEYAPPQYRALAFADMEIPIGHGEKMLAPKLEARMVQELAVQAGDKILEVGTGTGYMTALLASLGGHVVSVHINPEITKSAGDKHDVVVLTGSVPVLPEAFLKSLRPGGRLIAVVGEPPVMEARLVTCIAAGTCNTTGLFETCIAPLRNAQRPEKFVF